MERHKKCYILKYKNNFERRNVIFLSLILSNTKRKIMALNEIFLLAKNELKNDPRVKNIYSLQEFYCNIFILS